MTRRRSPLLLTLVPIVLLAACGDDDEGADPTTSPSTADAPTTTDSTGDSTGGDVVAGQPFPADRCAANEAAGTITYLSGFDFAATASIVEVLVAEQRGYFDELCLDVEVKPSFSVANYPEIAANNAQFASGGSFSEVVDFGAANDADFVVVAVEGKTGIDALIVKDGGPTDLEGLRGSTIGVKGRITSSVAAMLQQAGLVEGDDYTTVLLDGFDPKVHIEVPNIVGFPGYKSNEPQQLEAAGIPFTLLDPADYGIPGSFGILYTNAEFVNEHPTAAQDFVRAAMRGLADAVADPDAAAAIAVEFINANGNAMFLSPEGETARWNVDAGLVADTNANTALGVPEFDLLTAEVTAYAEIGLFGGEVPDITPYVDTALIGGVYAGDRTVIWPG
ncbi:MAG: ABC transporter substrate-binding protein [Acidimicrobiales bacterium]|nr:ABC transporter substrate-binding protein [Acidimicrobiales bacterium]